MDTMTLILHDTGRKGGPLRLVLSVLERSVTRARVRLRVSHYCSTAAAAEARSSHDSLIAFGTISLSQTVPLIPFRVPATPNLVTGLRRRWFHVSCHNDPRIGPSHGIEC